MIDLKPLVNKTVEFRFRGADLRLDLSHALFSSFDVDVGTRLLFKAVGRDEVLAASRRVLDAGCGVGVIGLGVAAAFPSCEVTLRDRDLLAVAFSERNRQKNKIPNARVEPGLIGAGRLGGPWDYILSNIPAKAGGPVIKAFLAEAKTALVEGGRLAVVVVKPLVDELLAQIGELGFSLLSEERGSMHRAFVLGAGAVASGAGASAAEPSGQPPGPAAATAVSVPAGEESLARNYFDFGAYLRRRGEFRLLGKDYAAAGFWGLPDFDTIGFPQAAAAEILGRYASGKAPQRALILNPGVGHAALWLSLSLGPPSLLLSSRDLLSLHAARANLEELASLQGRELSVEVSDLLSLDGLAEGSRDLLLEFADPVPEYDWVGDSWARARRLLAPGGSLVIAAPPTELVRLEKRRPEGFRLLGEKRKKGSAAAAWRRNA